MNWWAKAWECGSRNWPEHEVRCDAGEFMTTERVPVTVGDFRMRLLWLWGRVLRLSRRAPRRLRLCESLPLGERRFVAVVEFDAARFLLGGTASSLVLLARLADAGDRAEGEGEGLLQDGSKPASPAESQRESWSAAAAAAGRRRGGIC